MAVTICIKAFKKKKKGLGKSNNHQKEITKSFYV